MASYLPPSAYPPEPQSFGKPCGNSWHRTLTVTGKLKNYNYGSNIRKNLPPLVSGELPPLGRDSKEERELFERLDERRALIATTLANSDDVNSQQRASIQALLDRADDLFEEITNVYRKWERFPCFQGLQDSQICTWPLTWGDSVEAWRQRCGEFPFEPGKAYEAYDPGSGTNRVFVCPAAPGGDARLDGKTRREHRQEIRQIVIGILHHLRCAQATLTRIELHAQAKRRFREEEMNVGGLGIVKPDPGPSTPFGGMQLTAGPRPGDLDPSDIPPGPADRSKVKSVGSSYTPKDDDEEIELPDPDSALFDAVGGGGEDGGGDLEGATDDTTTKTVKYAAIGLGVATIGVVLYKGLKR